MISVFSQFFVLMTLFCIILDRNVYTRMIMLTSLLGLVVYMLYSSRKKNIQVLNLKIDTVLKDLPEMEFHDDAFFDVHEVPKKFKYLSKNVPLLTLLNKMKRLRTFNDHVFAKGCTYIEYFLKMTRCKVDIKFTEMNMIKDHIVNTFSEYSYSVPQELLNKIKFDVLLRTLDTVLYFEGMSKRGRVQDIYPVGRSMMYNCHLLSGH